MTTNTKLYPGDRVAFGDNECEIIVTHVSTYQPLAEDGVTFFTDQYGELKLAEFDGERWEIVLDQFLPPDLAAKAASLLSPEFG